MKATGEKLSQAIGFIGPQGIVFMSILKDSAT